MNFYNEDALTPRKIVEYLGRYIVGQDRAKRAVAIALRNRVRRRKLPEEMAREITPKNILMVGPTGVGKTEIARRLSQLVNAPFIKIEATKYTEVGYVGRDVESMIRDLVEKAYHMVKERHLQEVQVEAARRVEERLLDALLPRRKTKERVSDMVGFFLGQSDTGEVEHEEPEDTKRQATREKLRTLLREGKLDSREIEVELTESAQVGIPVLGAPGMDEMGINLGEMLSGLFPKKRRRVTMTVAEAKKALQAEEAEKLIDHDAISKEAVRKAQEEGIIFIDELDKVASASSSGSGPDVSREGVQRDLLPIIEGCTVNTKYGPIRTDHILFIGAGAFHKVKPSDLIPELQGRLPLRVELNPLTEDDLARILVEPENSLLKQYKALLETEEVELVFTEDGIAEIASIAARMNLEMENIGARRLHTILETLLEEIQFEAPERRGEVITVDAKVVKEKLHSVVADTDLRKYLL